jgi:hypothetical protein
MCYSERTTCKPIMLQGIAPWLVLHVYMKSDILVRHSFDNTLQRTSLFMPAILNFVPNYSCDFQKLRQISAFRFL